MPKKSSPAVEQFEHYFSIVEDPRTARTRHHELMPLLVMSLAGILCGAEGWEDLEDFAADKKEFFERLFDLPHGTPSADTFRRVITSLDPHQLESCLRAWILDVAESFKGEVIALDGKSVRGAFDSATRKTPLHLMHVWATRQRLVLGQMAVPGAPGEIDAIPKLLKLFDFRGAVVTSDANGATASTTQAVRDAGADFVLALKGNRKPQYTYMKDTFAALSKSALDAASTSITTDRGHGRTEVRTVHAIAVADWPFEAWRDVKSIARIVRERHVVGTDESSFEEAFYVTSLKPDAAAMNDIIRAHWSIENNLHWCLDIAFREDDRAIRDEVGAQNFALFSRIAMMMVRSDKTVKKSLRLKRKSAGWNESFLLQLLVGGISPAS